MLSRLSPQRRRFVLGVALLLLVALAVVAGLALRNRSTAAAPPDQSRPGPVLLVPGYGGSAESLSSLASWLRGAGRDVTMVDLPDRAQGDLTEQASSLAATASDVLKRTGAGSVDVVGYSAGGVVARIWVTENGGAAQVRRLVTLGSPHQGTDLARLGSLVSGSCPTACQQLSTDSSVLARLDGEPLPAGLVALSLWTTADDVVLPPSSAVIDGVSSPSLQSICPSDAVRHGGLPDDRLVQRVVTEALGTGPLPAWGPADCARLSS